MPRRTHDHDDGPVEKMLERMHNLIRSRMADLSPQERGRLWRSVDIHETHFYAYLRGNDRAASFAALDQICEKLKIRFALEIKK